MGTFKGTPEMEITDRMEDYFKSYLERHVNRVVRNAARPLNAGLIEGIVLARIALNHDRSKLEEPEYTPYVRRKWLERAGGAEIYRLMGDDVKCAIVHHVTTNPHHPEYWSDDYRGFETNEPCHVNDMPEECIIEMVCDWVAMGQELGNTARAWYDKTRDTRWIFDEKTKKRIEHWISIFENLDDEV